MKDDATTWWLMAPWARKALGRVASWWFAPAPAERLATLRILIGGYAFAYLWLRFGEFIAVANLPVSQWKPVGVTAWSGHLPPGAVIALVVVTMIALALFVLGAKFRYVAPIAAIGLLFVTTYRSSWGMVFHTENLLVLHVGALALAPAADAWSVDARWFGRQANAPAGYGWAIKLLVALAVATYMLAGIAKLRIAGPDWIDGELLRNQIAIDNLRKALLGDSIAPLATQFLEHPAGFTVFSVMTLVLELGAPLALLGGWVGRLWAIAVWGFHVGVVALMNIWFLYPLVFVAFAPVFHVERPVLWLIARVRKKSP